MLGVNPNLFACLMLLFRSPSVPGCTKLLELEDQRIDVDHGWKIPSGLQPIFFEPAIATCSGGGLKSQQDIDLFMVHSLKSHFEKGSIDWNHARTALLVSLAHPTSMRNCRAKTTPRRHAGLTWVPGGGANHHHTNSATGWLQTTWHHWNLWSTTALFFPTFHWLHDQIEKRW